MTNKIKTKTVDCSRHSKPEQVKKCAIYCRAAIKVANRRESLESQEEICGVAAKRDDKIISYVFKDLGSGVVLCRPMIKELIKKVKGGYIDSIYITSPDRLSRNTADYFNLKSLFENYGVTLKVANDSPEQKFFETISASLADYEKNIRSERIKAGLARRRELSKSTN